VVPDADAEFPASACGVEKASLAGAVANAGAAEHIVASTPMKRAALTTLRNSETTILRPYTRR
jgi:hypothetical protein